MRCRFGLAASGQFRRALVAAALLVTGAKALRAADEYRWELPRGFPKPRVPKDNPMSDAKVRLGRYLFYDKRLSINGAQSCASCHRQELAFTDGRAQAIGATGEKHSRSAMSLVNVAYDAALTWSDPNARSLEKQALTPLFGEHPVEMGMSGRKEALLAMMREDAVYRETFPAAFAGGARGAHDVFTIENVSRALASFERSILSARSPYDRYYYGNERDAISESARRGEGVFFTDSTGGCFRCHGGFDFSDATVYEGGGTAVVAYHNTGLYNLPGPFSYPESDLGLYRLTHELTDVGKFKAPSLRNIALTAPYMHNGGVATLEDAIQHYASGGLDNPNRDPRVKRIHLTEQNRRDLLEFLRSLTDEEVTRDPRFGNPW